MRRRHGVRALLYNPRHLQSLKFPRPAAYHNGCYIHKENSNRCMADAFWMERDFGEAGVIEGQYSCEAPSHQEPTYSTPKRYLSKAIVEWRVRCYGILLTRILYV